MSETIVSANAPPPSAAATAAASRQNGLHTNKNPEAKNVENRDGPEEQQSGHDGVSHSSHTSSNTQAGSNQEDQPAGGYDGTPAPRLPPGYTVKITIHRAQNLPAADINSLASDPYVITQIYTTNPTRHKEDPPVTNRTFTIRRDVNPEWNAEWIVGNVPSSGFKLKCRIYDEDPADHDDRLGNAHIHVSHVDGSWQGFKERSFKLKKRMGSKRAYLLQALATAVGRRSEYGGHLIVSIENLGPTECESSSGVYTIGPMWWTQHYSPLLGRIVNRKTPNTKEDEEEEKQDPEKAKAQRYNFQANQFQLHGPVPPELYHRYVEFKPFVKSMFKSSGIRGFLLYKALRHQHDQIYHFDRTTETGYLGTEPNYETTLKFLDMVHYAEGGRIYTYVITLDGLFRFTETGKEFGVDMLSKHTMHSNVAVYIAFSGEFFVRRSKHHVSTSSGGSNTPKDPAAYELVIDNDSGTYRPNAELLPKFKDFLHGTLPGIRIKTLDCQKDADLQQRLKKEQRQRKEEEGDHIVYRQASRSSSISSSDESDLDSMIAAQGGTSAAGGLLKTVKHDLSARGNLRKQRVKELGKGQRKQDTAGTQGVVKEKEGVAPGGQSSNGKAPVLQE